VEKEEEDKEEKEEEEEGRRYAWLCRQRRPSSPLVDSALGRPRLLLTPLPSEQIQSQ